MDLFAQPSLAADAKGEARLKAAVMLNPNGTVNYAISMRPGWRLLARQDGSDETGGVIGRTACRGWDPDKAVAPRLPSVAP
jgi:hypothetical protein